MAPELAAVYVSGWLPCAAVTGLQIWLHRRKTQTPAYRQLQNNLKKVDLYWRESRSDFEPWAQGKETKDLHSYEKNLLLMGAFFLFLSWGGLILNLIVLASVHSLAISRKEQRVMASDLTRQDLPVTEIQKTLKELA